MISNLIFFNHFHNGDIFFSKGYIRAISRMFPSLSQRYYHENNPKIIEDLNVPSYSIHGSGLPMREKFALADDSILINTWIGNYIQPGINCNWKSLHTVYEHIYARMSEVFEKQFVLDDIMTYSPFVDDLYFSIPNNIEIDYENTIIFSNGPALSGQSEVSSTEGIVDSLLQAFPEKSLILTYPSSISHKNISYTSDLLQASMPDLNEISILSRRCKYLIGRQSGPFSFMQTDKLLSDSRKVVVSFSNSPEVDWFYQIDTPFPYVNLMDHDESLLIESMIKFMEENS